MKRLLSYLEKHGVSGHAYGVKIRVLTPITTQRGSQIIFTYRWETINATYADVRAYLGY